MQPQAAPEIEAAAQSAISTLNSRSNSLFPFELKEILSFAVLEEEILELELKLTRGQAEETRKVAVKKHEGQWKLQ